MASGGPLYQYIEFRGDGDEPALVPQDVWIYAVSVLHRLSSLNGSPGRYSRKRTYAAIATIAANAMRAAIVHLLIVVPAVAPVP